MRGVTVLLLGGAHDRTKVTLTAAPRRIDVRGEVYDRIDDPETGEFLGAYAVTEGRAGPTPMTPGGRHG